MLFFSFIPLHIAAKINIISDSHSIVLFIFSFIIEEMAFVVLVEKRYDKTN